MNHISKEPALRGNTADRSSPLQANAFGQRSRRRLRLPEASLHPLTTSDGANLLLTRYRGGRRGPVMLAPGFGVTASSFAHDTVDENLVEVLVAAEYDVWLFDYRASPNLSENRPDFSIDDIALRDWPSAVAHVRHATDSTVQVVAHCVGSMTLLMALLEGLTGVRSVVSSQLTLHACGWWSNRLLANLDVAAQLIRVGVQQVDINGAGTKLDQCVNSLLALSPVPKGEECTRPTCRRVFGLFGPSYNHAKLNTATHATLNELFGVTAIPPFRQLARIARHGHALDATGGNPYLTVAKIRRLTAPILFLSGEQNSEFSPRSSERTMELLLAVNPDGPFQRKVLASYGHLDCFIGQDAARDVYPSILEHLNTTARTRGVARQ